MEYQFWIRSSFNMEKAPKKHQMEKISTVLKEMYNI